MRQNQSLSKNPLDMTLEELFPTQWLKAEHLRGRNVKVTIAKATVEMVYDRGTSKKQPKTCIWFEGKEKGLLIGKTHFTDLMKATGGTIARHFVGHQVILRPAITPAGQPTIAIDPMPDEVSSSAQPVPFIESES